MFIFMFCFVVFLSSSVEAFCFEQRLSFSYYFVFKTVPGSVPSQSLKATPFEDRILLYWKEPTEPNGVIIQYEVLTFVPVVGAVTGPTTTTTTFF